MLLAFVWQTAQPVLPAHARTVSLKVRSVEFKDAGTEKSPCRVERRINFDPQHSALILIDVWKYHRGGPQKPEYKSVLDAKLAPLIRLLRKNQVLVVHAATGMPIADAAKPQKGDCVLSWDGSSKNTRELAQLVAQHKIRTLFYAGFAANNCLLTKPAGIREMKLRGNINADIILVRDATRAFETAKSRAGEWLTDAAIFQVETLYGSTTTTGDLANSLDWRTAKLTGSRSGI